MSRKSRQNEVLRQEQQARQAARNKRNLIAAIAALVVVVLVIVLATALKPKTDAADNAADVQVTQAPAATTVPQEFTATDWVEFEVEGYGTITAELYGEVAPITVENFVKLASEGFYDGLTFHRIISGFMIQGGDPNGNGTGGSGQNIKGEFSGNGVNNPIAHERGVLSMARSSMPDSASSQFFIMHQAAPHLDGAYAAFGKVLTGMDVVDAICAQTPVLDGNGTVASANQPRITAVRVIEKPAE